jgi:O-antigen/teichoic acid export membrane protein
MRHLRGIVNNELVGTLVLMRFITPDDYGTVLTASIIVITAGALTSFAFGQYLIAKRAGADVAAQAMVLYVGLGVVAMSVVYCVRSASFSSSARHWRTRSRAYIAPKPTSGCSIDPSRHGS